MVAWALAERLATPSDYMLLGPGVKRTPPGDAVGDTVFGTLFGSAAATNGEIVAVGAKGESFGENAMQGAVYLFARDQGGPDNWGQIRRITAPDAAAGEQLGAVVDLHADTLVASHSVWHGETPVAYIFSTRFIFLPWTAK